MSQGGQRASSLFDGSGSTPTSPGLTTTTFFSPADDSTQFEDAEDDDSAPADTPRANQNQYQFDSQYVENNRPLSFQPMVPNKAPPLVRPRGSVRSSTREAASPSGNGNSRTNSRASSSTSTYANGNAGENRRPVSYDYGNKENVRARGAPPPIAPRPPLGERAGTSKRATLGLAIQQPGGFGFEHDASRSVSPALRGSMFKKKKGQFFASTLFARD